MCDSSSNLASKDANCMTWDFYLTNILILRSLKVLRLMCLAKEIYVSVDKRDSIMSTNDTSFLS